MKHTRTPMDGYFTLSRRKQGFDSPWERQKSRALSGKFCGLISRPLASDDGGVAPLHPARAPSGRREGLPEIDALTADQVAGEFIDPDAEPTRAVAVMDDPL